MGFEFQILDKLQTIHTPLLDRFMVAITKLGDAGIVWIILTVILLLILFHRDIQLHHLHRSVRCILREEREWQQEL